MCAETGCVPYVIVVVLSVALVLSCLAVNVDCWGGSVCHCAYWDCYVAKARCAAFACFSERHRRCIGGLVCCDCDVGHLALVMFPLIARSTVEPLSVVAGTVVARLELDDWVIVGRRWS